MNKGLGFRREPPLRLYRETIIYAATFSSYIWEVKRMNEIHGYSNPPATGGVSLAPLAWLGTGLVETMQQLIDSILPQAGAIIPA